MKRSVWTVTPFLYVITGVVALMAAASWFWDPIIFAVEGSVALVMIAATVISTIWFHSHVRSAVVGVKRLLDGETMQTMGRLAIPVVVTGDQEDIVWMNDAFQEIAGETQYLGRSITSVLGEASLE